MIVKGQRKQDICSMDDILKHTKGGWDTFTSEIPNLKVGRAFKSPFHKDMHPSASLVYKGDMWFMKDWTTGEVYTAVKFIQKKYSLTFGQAIQKIAVDSGLANSQLPVYKPVQQPDIEHFEKEVAINCFYKKWGKRQKEFWENTEVDEKHCEKYNVLSVDQAAIKHSRIGMKKDEIVWAYHTEDGKIKLYFPEREKGERFKGNVRGKFMWNFNNIGQCEKLIVIKSVKDMLVSTILFPCTVATQNEDSKIFIPEVVKKLEGVGKQIFVFYGSDDQGKSESQKITKEHSWKWVNCPNEYLKEDINDAYSMVKKYSIKSLEELYKKKGIL